MVDSEETSTRGRKRTGSKQCHPSVSFHDSRGGDRNKGYLDMAAIKEHKQRI